MAAFALLIGVVVVLAAFGTNTAPEGTHNLGLLQQQMMTLHVGLALLIIAAVRWDAQPLARRGASKSVPMQDDPTTAVDPNVERDNKRWIIGMLVVLGSIIALALLKSNY